MTRGRESEAGIDRVHHELVIVRVRRRTQHLYRRTTQKVGHRLVVVFVVVVHHRVVRGYLAVHGVRGHHVSQKRHQRIAVVQQAFLGLTMTASCPEHAVVDATQFVRHSIHPVDDDDNDATVVVVVVMVVAFDATRHHVVRRKDAPGGRRGAANRWVLRILIVGTTKGGR